MHGKNRDICEKCKRPSCISPSVCPNLNADHRPLLEIYKEVDALPGMKKSFIGSGVRYDLLLHQYKDPELRKAAEEYTKELVVNHVSGRLKVAPEHTSDRVLHLMRKPSFQLFHEFKRIFDRINREAGLRQQIIPYFISSHPGCTEEDMAELAAETRDMDFQLEQVQDFTPTPMTVSTDTWYSGYHPYTLEEVFSAHTPQEKLKQRMFFFWYKPEERQKIITELRKMGRTDLIKRLYPANDGFSSTPTNYNNSHQQGNRKRQNKNRTSNHPKYDNKSNYSTTYKSNKQDPHSRAAAKHKRNNGHTK